jgi:F0F1-type ATP synthase membrane subunit c/vacuolar-type H+-ATPase subunit K
MFVMNALISIGSPLKRAMENPAQKRSSCASVALAETVALQAIIIALIVALSLQRMREQLV